MPITTFSSRRFNQDASGAKRAAKDGPVFITDRGRPAHVLMTIEEYRKLATGKRTIVEMLAMPEGTDFDFDFDTVRSRELARGFDFDSD